MIDQELVQKTIDEMIVKLPTETLPVGTTDHEEAVKKLPNLTTEMEEELYSRHEQLNLTIPKRVTIIGTGGTGTWTAILLAMSGVKYIQLMDEDYLELSNLNRLPYTIDGIGKAKSDLLKQFIQMVRPSTEVITMPRVSLMNINLIEGTDVFDCTDRHDIQMMLNKVSKDSSIKYTRVGYDGTHITVTGEIPQWDSGLETASENGYAVTPSWVIPSVLAACFGVIKAMMTPSIEVSSFIDELVSPELTDCKTQSYVELTSEALFLEKFGVPYNKRTGKEKCCVCGKAYDYHQGNLFCSNQYFGFIKR